jgi:hypothetical protein
VRLHVGLAQSEDSYDTLFLACRTNGHNAPRAWDCPLLAHGQQQQRKTVGTAQHIRNKRNIVNTPGSRHIFEKLGLDVCLGSLPQATICDPLEVYRSGKLVVEVRMADGSSWSVAYAEHLVSGLCRANSRRCEVQVKRGMLQGPHWI